MQTDPQRGQLTYICNMYCMLQTMLIVSQHEYLQRRQSSDHRRGCDGVWLYNTKMFLINKNYQMIRKLKKSGPHRRGCMPIDDETTVQWLNSPMKTQLTHQVITI